MFDSLPTCDQSTVIRYGFEYVPPSLVYEVGLSTAALMCNRTDTYPAAALQCGNMRTHLPYGTHTHSCSAYQGVLAQGFSTLDVQSATRVLKRSKIRCHPSQLYHTKSCNRSVWDHTPVSLDSPALASPCPRTAAEQSTSPSALQDLQYTSDNMICICQ